MGYDKIADYLNVAIPEYFAKKRIEKEKIVSPDPTIAVPVIEALRYTSHKEELREMFTKEIPIPPAVPLRMKRYLRGGFQYHFR